jgi:hypothetical protein
VRTPAFADHIYIMINRGQRQTDEACRSQVCEMAAEAFGWLFRGSRPWHSGASLRALSLARSSGSGRFLRET